MNPFPEQKRVASIEEDCGAQTISNKDPKGYYERLGVDPAASSDAIKAAFRRLAKSCHPDTSSSEDAKQKFQALNEAYEVLGDPEKRASYDAATFQETTTTQKKSTPPDPVVCSKCGKVTVQPRYAVYRYVVSLLFVTTRNALQGIFCADCGKRAALRASAISAFAGWWGFPWGPIYTVIEVIRNAKGGFEPNGSREILLWRNAVAFLAKGNPRLSYALAREARSSKDEEISLAAFRLMDLLKSEGVGDVPPLKDGWSSRSQFFLHLLLLACLPGALAAYIAFAPPASINSASRWTVMSPPPAEGSDMSAQKAQADNTDQNNAQSSDSQATAPVQAACATLPSNGTVLTDNMNWSTEANALEIKNGSGGDAIIKLRDATTGETLVSFFVANNETARYNFIADGNYRIQYAFGDALDGSCTKFAQIRGAGEFPDTENFTTEITDTQIVHHVLSYTLYGIPNGNVQPNSIDADAFNRP